MRYRYLKFIREKHKRCRRVKRHFLLLKEKDFSKYQVMRLCEAFHIFMEPFDPQWEMIKPIHEKRRLVKYDRARETIAELFSSDRARSKLPKYHTARETIAELMAADGARSEVLAVIDSAILYRDTTGRESALESIDTAIFWAKHSFKDIRLHFRDRSKETLLAAFTERQTTDILKDFGEIQKKLSL